LLSKPTAFGVLLKIFLKYSREAYRTGTEKLANGSGLFGFGKRKSKSYSQELIRSQKPHSDPAAPRRGSAAQSGNSASASSNKLQLPSTSSSTNLPARKPTNLAKYEQEDWQQTASGGADQALERTRQNQQRQIYLLETRLGKSVRLQMVLGWSAVGALVFSSLFLIASFLADYRSYAPIFLIGNGVMGAIILRQLVRSRFTWKENPGETVIHGGNGDKQC
jgi:hypothetical protein